jgi:hypothetical protein
MQRSLEVLLTSVALSAACTGYVEGGIEPPLPGAAAGQSPGGTAGTAGTGTGGAGSSAGAGAGGGSSLAACDVLALLQTRCASCHSDPPARGVPMPLVDAADLAAEAPNYPGELSIDVSIARMRDTAAPMPPMPAAPPTERELATLEGWRADGMPAKCVDGSGGAGGKPGSPYDTPVVCTSQATWRNGNEESPKMHPGGACIACHDKGEGEGPRFAFAGTIYPTAHEPTDCNGVDGPTEKAKVVILDKNGATFTLSANAVGNFYLAARTGIALPYRAKVVAGESERLMATEQTNGDCNFCHTESGKNDAPGRIMAP